MPAFQNKKKKSYKTKPRLTTGIRMSCATKRKLYLTYRKSNNPLHKDHYKLYCLILSKVILAAKQLYYKNCIKKSFNKSKTTWNIIKTITKNKNSTNNTLTMNVDNKLSSNPLTISNALNSYFLSVAENIFIKNSTINSTTDNNDPMNNLRQNFGHISSQMKLKNTNMQEINKIINSIK